MVIGHITRNIIKHPCIWHTPHTLTHKNKHTPAWISTHKIYGKPHNKWWLQNIPRITSFLRNTKQYHHLSYVSLCNYTLLPVTVKVLETFLKASLWKPFQLVCHILNDVSSITKVLPHQCWFQSREQVKISRSQVRRVWEMLQCCHIILDYEILDQNQPMCWSIVMKEKPTVGSTLLMAFPSDCISRWQRMSMSTFETEISLMQ